MAEDVARMMAWKKVMVASMRMIHAFQKDHLGSECEDSRSPLSDVAQARWMVLWPEIRRSLDVFEEEYGRPTAQDRHFAAKLANSTRGQMEGIRKQMQAEYPDLPAVEEQVIEPDWGTRQEHTTLDVHESMFAHLVDGVDPADDRLTGVEENALVRTGLGREEFLEARARLRTLIEQLPEDSRQQAADLVRELRRRRN